MKSTIYNRVVKVTVPATTANLGPGFDCLGLALELRNEVTFLAGSEMSAFDSFNDSGLEIQVDGVDAEKIPCNQHNLLFQAAESIFRVAGFRPARLLMKITNHIPVGSGLGSSSSAIIAGMIGANALINAGLTEEEILHFAVKMEGHPDNVAPALLGGLVLGLLPDSRYGPTDLLIRKLPLPNLRAIIVMPDYVLLTSEARAVLPETVAREDAIFNASRLGLLILGLTRGDFQNLAVSMADRLHQPYRLPLIPGAEMAFEAAYASGALGVALSGAGPSLLAFTEKDPDPVAQAMINSFQAAGVGCRHWILHPAAVGATCVISTISEV